MNRTGGRLQLSGDQLDNGRLAGTGRAYQKYKVPIFDLHTDTLERLRTYRIGLNNIIKIDHFSSTPFFVVE
jgi:hypothetical protein